MADVFISYAKESRRLVEQLAIQLVSLGYTVWWDSSLVAGRSFREMILRELDAAEAAIVVWTPHSVASEWVISEADRAYGSGRLIPVKVSELHARDIPMPFGVLHTVDVQDIEGIKRGLIGLIGKGLTTEEEGELNEILVRHGIR